MERTLNVLINVLNSKYIHSSLAPWYLLAGIDRYCECKNNNRAELLEATVNEDPDGILNRILSRLPDIVAFSCYIWNIQRIRRLIRKVKEKKPETVIILGGPEVGFNAAEILRDNPEQTILFP